MCSINMDGIYLATWKSFFVAEGGIDVLSKLYCEFINYCKFDCELKTFKAHKSGTQNRCIPFVIVD